MAGERPSKRARRNCDDRMKVPSCGAVGGGVYKRVFYCIVCIWLFIPLYIKAYLSYRFGVYRERRRHAHKTHHTYRARRQMLTDAYWYHWFML